MVVARKTVPTVAVCYVRDHTEKIEKIAPNTLFLFLFFNFFFFFSFSLFTFFGFFFHVLC